MQVDTSGWSGEGEFTQVVMDRLSQLVQLVAVKVEDAPASRSEADYNFLSNEIFVIFATTARRVPVRRWGIIPGTRTVEEPAGSLADLCKILESSEGIGAPDYADEGLIQYLRTQRIVPPYQTRGYKLVELVRIYETGRQTL